MPVSSVIRSFDMFCGGGGSSRGAVMAGVTPVVIGLGIGSESRQPMAVVIAGGMLSSTVLTLVVVPVIYSYLDQLSKWSVFEKMKTRIMARDAHRVQLKQKDI